MNDRLHNTRTVLSEACLRMKAQALLLEPPGHLQAAGATQSNATEARILHGLHLKVPKLGTPPAYITNDEGDYLHM